MTVSTPEGFFVDWDGNVRSTTDCGGGYHCEVDTVARYVGIKSPNGVLMHEATYYKDWATLEKKGIKGTLVPGSHPWARKSDGF